VGLRTSVRRPLLLTLGLSNIHGDSMLKYKDGKTEEQFIDEILRDYLLRCFSTVCKQYEPIQKMSHQQEV